MRVAASLDVFGYIFISFGGGSGADGGRLKLRQHYALSSTMIASALRMAGRMVITLGWSFIRRIGDCGRCPRLKRKAKTVEVMGHDHCHGCYLIHLLFWNCLEVC